MVRHWWKKSKATHTEGKIHHAHELEELIMLKWPDYPRKSRDSVQVLSKYPWILHRTRTNNPKICKETQNIPNIQNYLEKEEQSWRYHAPWFLTVRQSYSNQSSIVLAQISMGQHREPRNETRLAWAISLQERRQEYTRIYNGGRDSLFNKRCWENWTATRMKDLNVRSMKP